MRQLSNIVVVFFAGAVGCSSGSANTDVIVTTRPFDAGPRPDLGSPISVEDAAPIFAPDVWVIDEDAGDAGVAVVDADSGFAPDAAEPPGRPYPAPSAWGPNRGSGGPIDTFAEPLLYQNCAYLNGGRQDITDHHNLVTMFDGYLLMPWAPEYSHGGITFFDISHPCLPAVVGTGYSEDMRESHAIGIANLGGRWWAAVNYMRDIVTGGVQFWDISDVTAPMAVSSIETPDFRYPDAYARVTLSLAWQAPWVFVAGADNGVFVIDASDPLNPRLVTQYTFNPVLRVGTIFAVGNLLFVSAAEGARAVLIDISDPAAPQPIPGGEFLAVDDTGTPREAYFSNIAGGYAFFARKDSGGGVIIYDIQNPSMPTYSGSHRSDGNGGYVFVKNNFAFVGESETAAIYDITDHAAITEVARLDLAGDLDTITPIGNVVVLSVDADAESDRGSAIAPWRMEPDDQPPVVKWVYPADGATALPLTSRVGLMLDEFVDPKSAFEGSVRLYETGTNPAVTRVDGYVSVSETIINFAPIAPLKSGTRYTIEVPAGGVADFNGNAVDVDFAASFTTVGP